MRNHDILDDDKIRLAFERFSSKVCVGQNRFDPREFSVAFAEELRKAFRDGWHRGWQDAPNDDSF